MFRILISAIAVFATSTAYAAFEFSPIITTLAPSGPEASTSMTVSNPGDTKIPVQVTIVAREPNEEGKEVYAESDAVSDMFRIFPGQVVLNPKETRTIRVTYVGSPKIKSEMAFRVIAEELPVDVSDPNKVYKKAVANVTIAIKYVGSLYVTPAGAKPELQVEAKKSETAPAKKGDKVSEQLVVIVTNKGTTHLVVRKPTLKIQSLVDNSEVIFQENDLPSFNNLNILAGKTRKFVLDWPKKLPVGAVKASFDLPKD